MRVPASSQTLAGNISNLVYLALKPSYFIKSKMHTDRLRFMDLHSCNYFSVLSLVFRGSLLGPANLSAQQTITFLLLSSFPSG